MDYLKEQVINRSGVFYENINIYESIFMNQVLSALEDYSPQINSNALFFLINCTRNAIDIKFNRYTRVTIIKN